MRTKKALMVVALAAMVGFMGLQHALADEMNCMGSNHRHFQKMDDMTKAKIAKFRADTKDLRKQMAMKQAEESALIRSQTPDIDAVKKAAGDLFDLRMTMMEKANTAGLLTFGKHGDEKGKFVEKCTKIEKFFADTKDLRKQMSVERAEKRALMHSSSPDSSAIAKIAGKLFDLKTTLHEKAITAGLPGYFHEKGHDRYFSLGHNRGFMS